MNEAKIKFLISFTLQEALRRSLLDETKKEDENPIKSQNKAPMVFKLSGVVAHLGKSLASGKLILLFFILLIP